MKRLLVVPLFIILNIGFAYAQKINLEKWVSHQVDSLRHEKVDTIEYFHAYCGECAIVEKPPMLGAPSHNCDVGNGWTQLKTIIIYQQNNHYYSLKFNCGYPPIKDELQNIKSIKYFLSIVPDLIKRDKYENALYKKHKLNPPVTVDGGYEEAVLYIPQVKSSVYMQENQKTDKAWRSFFWIGKQTQLLKLLEDETADKK
jgi:hypothetical protein